MAAHSAAPPQTAPPLSKDAMARLKAEQETVSQLLSEYEMIHAIETESGEEAVAEPAVRSAR